jgi:tetratricopeptide (TPR) repeat protein
MAALAAQDLTQAEQFYRQMVRQQPRHTEAWLQLGLIAMHQGRFETAAEALATATSLEPGHVQARHQLASAYGALGQADKAAAEYAEVLRLKPDCAEAHNDWGISLARQGKHEEAAAAFRRAAELKPELAEAHNNWGNALVERNDFKSALPRFKKALAIRPEYAEAHHNLAFALARMGQIDEAVAGFQEAVRVRPDYVEAHQQLAGIFRDRGQIDQAVESFRAIVRHRPQQAGIRDQLAMLVARQGKLDEAAALLHQALLFHPESHDTYNNLGVVLVQRDQLEEAAAAFRQALKLKPDFAEALNNLGNTLLRQQKAAEALPRFQKAIELRPDYAQAHCNLGTALMQQGQTSEAVSHFREALRLQPDYIDAHLSLGNACQGLGRLHEAVECCRHALQHAPGHPAALVNLGIALAQLGQLDDAVSAYEDVLQRQPKSIEAHNSLGVTRLHQGRLTDGIACFDRALGVNPEAAEPRLNRALTLLALGDFERGWEEYEWRWKQKHAMPRTYPQPAWDGKPMAGRLLLYAEQGLGDTLQFIRYASLAKERAGSVIVEVHGPLKNLAATCPGIDVVVEAGTPLPPFDAHAALMTVPRLFGTNLTNIPAVVPYLSAEAGMRQRWRQILEVDDGFKVGIVWQGNPRYGGDRFRSIPLAKFKGLAEVPGVRLYSLQKGAGAEQLVAGPESSKGLGATETNGMYSTNGMNALPSHDSGRATQSGFAITDLGKLFSPDFRDAAGLLDQLDLLISVDTATAHLAGALGRPFWVLLPFHADWRWLCDREDSVWYPTARLFRQRRWGDWDEVLARVAQELAKVAQAPRPRKFTVDLDFTEMIDRLALQSNGTADQSLAALRRTMPWPEHMDERFNRLKGAHESLKRLEEEIDARTNAGDLVASAETLLRDFANLRRQRAEALAEIAEAGGQGNGRHKSGGV